MEPGSGHSSFLLVQCYGKEAKGLLWEMQYRNLFNRGVRYWLITLSVCFYTISNGSLGDTRGGL